MSALRRTSHATNILARRATVRLLTALLLVSLLLVPFATVSADEESGNLPGGTSIGVSINAPADNAVFPPGPVTVTGDASIGAGVVIKDTIVVYVVDRSGSMSLTANANCDGTSGNDTRLVCVKEALKTANAAAADANSSVGEVGLVAFSSGAQAMDVDRSGNTQLIVAPNFDGDGNGTADVVDVSNSLTATGQTDYEAALASARSLLLGSAKPVKIVIFLSDGEANEGKIANVPPFPAGTKIFSFALGAGLSCSSGISGNTLNDVAAKGTAGGNCTATSDFTAVGGLITDAIGSQLTSLTYTINGGSPTAIPNTSIDPDLPVAGPGSVTYSFTTGALSAGTYNICVTANGTDAGGEGSVTDCHTVVINAPPSVEANGPYSGDEGSAIPVSGTVTDPDSPGLTTAWTYAPAGGVDAGATCAFADAGAASTTVTCTDDGTYTLTLTADDGVNPAVTDTATLTVANVAPVLDITAPADGALYAVNTAVNLSASFTDAGTNDTHACTLDWDDGAGAQTGSVAEVNGAGTCTGTRTFTAAGVYTIEVIATDDDGAPATDSVMVVVYDPSAGFVTGGGWIDSQPGAYTADPTLSGRANFGFVSKYKKGTTTPEGQTEFQFKVGNLNFHSTAYQWLVIAGPKAQYKGTGTINGGGNYGFLLTATDGQQPGGGGADKFRIKIWDIATGDIVYDNASGVSEDIDAANPQIISGGSIVIHSK